MLCPKSMGTPGCGYCGCKGLERNSEDGFEGEWYAEAYWHAGREEW
jgi:hypothetical protein